MLITRIDVVRQRLSDALPTAYAVRTDRLIAEKSVPIVVIERTAAKPMRVQLSTAPSAQADAIQYLAQRAPMMRVTAAALMDDFHTLLHANPLGAWPLRPDTRPPREVHVVGDEARGADGLPDIARNMLFDVDEALPPGINALHIREICFTAADRREVKRHFVSMCDGDGERASLPWTAAIALALYRLSPTQGEEPEANAWRLSCWSSQLRVTPEHFINLLLALNTPVTLFGLTAIRR